MKKKKSGFTLVEMIIVVALITIVLGIVSSMFITGNKVFSDSDVKSTLQIEAQTIQENISKIGMESINIKSIGRKNVEDESIVESISISDESVKIAEAAYSNFRSELTDMNGKNTNVSNNKWLAINKMVVNSYEENSGNITGDNEIPIIEYIKNGADKTGTLSVNGRELSTNVESVRVKPINIDNNQGNFMDAKAISICIVLSKKKGYSDDVTYPISIEVRFRNNFINNHN